MMEVKKAPRWKWWMARLFGERYQNTNLDGTVTGYWWRGTFYLNRHEIH